MSPWPPPRATAGESSPPVDTIPAESTKPEMSGRWKGRSAARGQVRVSPSLWGLLSAAPPLSTRDFPEALVATAP
jgi:hypothetical protein